MTMMPLPPPPPPPEHSDALHLRDPMLVPDEVRGFDADDGPSSSSRGSIVIVGGGDGSESSRPHRPGFDAGSRVYGQ